MILNVAFGSFFPVYRGCRVRLDLGENRKESVRFRTLAPGSPESGVVGSDFFNTLSQEATFGEPQLRVMVRDYRARMSLENVSGRPSSNDSREP
jgi:hypothetical protein